MKCNQCEWARINGVFCHETGCPNEKKKWDKLEKEWVRFYECSICGFEVRDGSICCEQE